jgi:hypothetical protein
VGEAPPNKRLARGRAASDARVKPDVKRLIAGGKLEPGKTYFSVFYVDEQLRAAFINTCVDLAWNPQWVLQDRGITLLRADALKRAAQHNVKAP